VEDFVQHLMNLDPLWVYIAVAGIAYIENIFPPFPSDVIVVAAGALIGLGTIDFALALFLATAGSTLGFMTMYSVGHWFGHAIVETGRLKFLPREGIHKAENWFRKYGYGLIVVNRFLAGTRAVVSFFAGFSSLKFGLTVFLSCVSALAWNSLLLSGGRALGKNWRTIVPYIETYSTVITIFIGLIVLGAIVRAVVLRRRSTKDSQTQQQQATKDTTELRG
jgi:membrane protein DedA with SNARE-associated domain